MFTRAPAQLRRGAQIGRLIPDQVDPARQGRRGAPDELAEAMAVASQAAYVAAAVGDTVGLTGEGRSTATLDLIGSQIALLDTLQKLDRPLVVVLIQGKPSTLPASELGADAIIRASNPGMRGGRAIAELLLRHIDPSERLPLSIPRPAGQPPVYYGQVRGHHGRFGEGLSYTTVHYSEPTIQNPDMSRYAPTAQPR